MTKISDLLVQLKITPSLSEARRLLNQGSVRIDGTRYLDNEDVAPGDHTLRVGSKVQTFTIPYDVPEDSLDNALNRLAKHIENGELLACTNPVAFLDTVTEKLEHTEAQLQVFVEFIRAERQESLNWHEDNIWHNVLNKLHELGLVKR
jgi:hypothetical protein